MNPFQEKDERLYNKINDLSEKQLVSFILYHKKEYYKKGISVLSDEAYDALERKLKEINPNNPVLIMVGYGYLKQHKGGQSG